MDKFDIQHAALKDMMKSLLSEHSKNRLGNYAKAKGIPMDSSDDSDDSAPDPMGLDDPDHGDSHDGSEDNMHFMHRSPEEDPADSMPDESDNMLDQPRSTTDLPGVNSQDHGDKLALLRKLGAKHRMK